MINKYLTIIFLTIFILIILIILLDRDKIDTREKKSSNELNYHGITATQLLREFPTNNKDKADKTIKRPLSTVKLFEKNAIIKGLVETDANLAQKDVFIGSIDEYKLGSEIGKGSFATVKQAIHKQTGERFAIKVYDKNKLSDSARRGTVKREIQILKKLNSKYTIKLYEVIETTKYVYKT